MLCRIISRYDVISSGIKTIFFVNLISKTNVDT